MPQITKKALAQYIRSGCMRQLALHLVPDEQRFAAERLSKGMPYAQAPRPGLRQVQEAGEEWQAEKLDDLTRTFGQASIVSGTSTQNAQGQLRYQPVLLANVLASASPLQFIVESQFLPVPAAAAGVFETTLSIQSLRTSFQLEYGSLRPDIIVVLPPGRFSRSISADGSISDLAPGDTRLQLRVIDIKMTADASPGYFAEVVYYSMALAAWLADNGLDQNYVVVPDAAIWPGSHDASNLRVFFNQQRSQGQVPTVDELWDAMQEDLEPVPFEVFAFRVRQFFQKDMVAALQNPWNQLEWHVDNRCSFCEYLGEDRGPNAQPPIAPHPDHCLPTAGRVDHLSRLAFVSQGARISLTQAGVAQVGSLAGRSHTDAVFDTHQTLRATRTVVAERAVSLQTNNVSIPALAGTSASMPKWTDLRIYLSVDFDIGSAISVAFGLKAFWLEPRAYNSPIAAQRATRNWQATARLVTNRDLADERRELLAFLRSVHDILEWCQTQDAANLQRPQLAGLSASQRNGYRTKVQFYVWDSLQFDHLARVIGRHLDAILQTQDISYLAWLFPPDDLLQNPDQATRRSAVTVVKDAVRTLVAAPVPHYYSLLEVARCYHEAGLPPQVASFNVHPHFETALSDQIPSERAHEIWAQVTTPHHWQTRMATYIETVEKRLRALETVQKRLEVDLRPQLSQAAPVIDVGPPPSQTRVSKDGQLWHAFAKLNAALEDLEVQQVRAMPIHERCARFRSARLVSRLPQAAEQAAIRQFGLNPRAGLRVYELAADSVDVKLKVGDFSVALAPANQQGFLDQRLSSALRGYPALMNTMQSALGQWFWRATMDVLTSVTVQGLDRTQRLIALEAPSRFPAVLDDLEANGFNLSTDVALDPIHADFFTKKLLEALQSVGNPAVARQNANVQAQVATGQRRRRGARQTAHTPPADFIWQPGAMGAAQLGRQLAQVRQRVDARLQAAGRSLNQPQWQAWNDALNHRARLIWGPPGTGKSLTLRAAALGEILYAEEVNRPVRVLLCASTYTAIDNVLGDVAADIDALLPGSVVLARVRSRYQASPGNIGPLTDVEVDRRSPGAELRQLIADLGAQQQSVLVGCTPEQVHNVLSVAQASELFDLIVVDEASQMDVAHAVLPFASLAADGRIVLAGDPLQLPPIHQAEPPKGLESMVGSIYGYWKDTHHVPESALDINYRSNSTIVSFVREAGYRASLRSHAPDLTISLMNGLPQAAPTQWPASLHWSQAWNALLDPNHPAVCFVYDDGQSSQRNEFEAEAVVSLLRLMYGNLASGLLNELDASGSLLPTPTTAATPQEFWSRGVGVVTPHRAQQALIVTRLHQEFGAADPEGQLIREAVDTVERFQGQQRDVIIASYTLGDPDQIAQEDEFLMSLNRFNVVASRARAKLIVLVSQEVINHLSSEVAVLHDSRLLKVFAESFCSNKVPLTLGWFDATGLRHQAGILRWH